MTSEVTRLLEQSRAGSEEALGQLIPLLHSELRRRADLCLRGQGAGHTLQATALINEMWLQLIDQRERNWSNQRHFLRIAASLMRRVLLRHAERRAAGKRAGDRQRQTLMDVPEIVEREVDLIALDEALQRLRQQDARKHEIVELRFFGGLEFADIAELLGVSERTVYRDWSFARSWLRCELEDDGES